MGSEASPPTFDKERKIEPKGGTLAPSTAPGRSGDRPRQASEMVCLSKGAESASLGSSSPFPSLIFILLYPGSTKRFRHPAGVGQSWLHILEDSLRSFSMSRAKPSRHRARCGAARSESVSSRLVSR